MDILKFEVGGDDFDTPLNLRGGEYDVPLLGAR
jgi:hypothetical protein